VQMEGHGEPRNFANWPTEFGQRNLAKFAAENCGP